MAAEPTAAGGPSASAERQILRVSVIAERQFLSAVLAMLREAAGHLGLAASEVANLERAVERVSLNVLEFGFEVGQAATFDVVLLRRPGHVVVAVEDRGRPFDFARLEEGAVAGTEAPLTEYAEAIHFQNLGTGGNRVEIVKRLPYQPIDEYVADPAVTPVSPADAPAVEPVTVRMMTPDDAIGVARCTYAVYNYTVPDDYLYFPDRMREMLHGGLLEMVVGATPSGEIACCLTCEVASPDAPVGYLGEGLVDPRFRHHGLLESMIKLIARRAAERHLLGLYGEAVTVHPYSQKSNIALGFTEVGVQLADEAPTVVFKQIDGTTSAKRTATVLTFLQTSPGPRRVVYPPERHRAMIERIYERGRFDRQCERAPAARGPAEARARVTVDVFPEWSEAAIRVGASGADVVDQVRAQLRLLCLRRIDWISLDLPLSDPGTQRAAPALEALGFFFAGVIPDLVGDDVLRLQYLNEIEADVESAQLASEFGRELFAYVVAAMDARPSGAA